MDLLKDIKHKLYNNADAALYRIRVCSCVCVQHKGHTNSHTRIYKLSYRRANTKTRVVHICAACSVEFSASDALYRARRVQIYIYFSIVRICHFTLHNAIIPILYPGWWWWRWCIRCKYYLCSAAHALFKPSS